MCELTESARMHLIEQGKEAERNRIADALERRAAEPRREQTTWAPTCMIVVAGWIRSGDV